MTEFKDFGIPVKDIMDFGNQVKVNDIKYKLD